MEDRSDVAASGFAEDWDEYLIYVVDNYPAGLPE